jgi:CheY-like chemotaxis protein
MANKKIIIVDDDPRNIFALSATLKSKGFECKSYTGAAEVLEVLHGTEIADVVLMDMMMPGMDGYEAIPEIRKIENRKMLPVVAVTAQAMHGDKEKCLAAGADAYISKPIDVDKLLDILAGFEVK